jgi:hypothetical protein
MSNGAQEVERRRGQFEGKVLAKIEDLTKSIDEFKVEMRDFRKDSYTKVNQNSKDIAKQKGINGVIATVVSVVTTIVTRIFYKA